MNNADATQVAQTVGYILSGIGVIILLPAMAFLLSREFKQKDKMQAAIDGLHEATTNLTAAIMDLRLLVVQNYVTQEKHESDMNDVYEHIREQAKRHEEDLNRHEKYCPGKGGTSGGV